MTIHYTCSATYQCFVDCGKSTSCIDVPEVWPDLQELWTVGTPEVSSKILKYFIGTVHT